jgi:DNA-binding ferritin-like protein
MAKLKEEKNNDDQKQNRFIKNEIIDMADRIEEMENIIKSQNEIIKKISNKIDSFDAKKDEDTTFKTSEKQKK